MINIVTDASLDPPCFGPFDVGNKTAKILIGSKT